jgi:hypothetical protein
MVFDDSYINWSDLDFPLYDWTEFYRDAVEHIPTNAPVPRGKEVQIKIVVRKQAY